MYTREQVIQPGRSKALLGHVTSNILEKLLLFDGIWEPKLDHRQLHDACLVMLEALQF